MDKIEDYAVNSERWLSLEIFEGEVWKKTEAFEGLCQVSNLGRVKVKKRTNSNNQFYPERILRVHDNGHGYLIVGIYIHNKQYQEYVHRLVATTFIPNPQKLPTVNHKDENKSNNKVSNLEWATYEYNNTYGTIRKRMRETMIKSGYTTPIDMYDIKGNFIKHYDCAFDLEKDGLSRRGAINVCTGRNRSYHGFVFVFAGERFRYRESDRHKKGEKKKVVKTDSNGTIVAVYDSIKAAEKDNNLNRNYLYSATYASSRKALINGFYFQITQ